MFLHRLPFNRMLTKRFKSTKKSLQKNDVNLPIKKGLFSLPNLRTVNDFKLFKIDCLNESWKFYADIMAASSQNRNVIEIFDNLSNRLCATADLSEFVRNAHTDPQFRNAANETLIDISGFIEKLNTDRELYDKLSSYLRDNRDNLTEFDRYVGKLFLNDFEISGIHLSERKRKKAVELNESILILSQRFLNYRSDPSKYFNNLQKHLREKYTKACARNETDAKSNDNFYLHESEEIRKCQYILANHYDCEKDEILRNLLDKRHELATLCGYRNFAERTVRHSAAESVEFVAKFLIEFNAKLESNKCYESDRRLLLESSVAGKRDGGRINVYDFHFDSMKVRRNRLRIDESEFQPYLTLDNCLRALNELVEQLFAVRLDRHGLDDEQTWLPSSTSLVPFADLFKFKVHHRNEGFLGEIYCDFWQRSLKQPQDCHFTVRGHKVLAGGEIQQPVVVVMLNLSETTASVCGQQLLLTPQAVENLFHEFGHALAAVLGRTRYQHVSGTRCPTDLAEVPSTLMELFAFDSRVVARYAKHYETGVRMPDLLMRKLIVSRHLFAAHELKLQTFYALLDISLHRCANQYVEGVDCRNLLHIYRQLHRDFYCFDYVEDTAWYLHFNHLINYGAKYYSYLFSRAISSLIWQNKFCDSYENWSQNGELLRNMYLAHGGGKHPKQLIYDYLGFSITPDNISNALINELEIKYRTIENYFDEQK